MNMDWILQCVIWITLTSAYKCRQHEEFYDYLQDRDSQEDVSPPHVGRFQVETLKAMRRIDHEMTHDSMTAESNDKNIERMNERSIAANSGIQRVQEEERRRVQTRVDDPTIRTENGSYKIVNNYPNTHSVIANGRGQLDERRSNMQDSVVFPGPTSESSQEYIPEVPEECRRLGICENVPNYPTELAARIIAQLGEKRNRFHVDVLDTPEIVQRIGPAEQNIEMCDFRERVIPPQSAPDKSGKWYFILNDKEKPLQGYRVETCSTEHSKCNDKVAYFYDNYKGTCKQKYVTRLATVIDRTGEPKFDMPLVMPSCCSCVVTYSANGK